MYMLIGWWFLSSGSSYPPVFTVDSVDSLFLFGSTFFLFVAQTSLSPHYSI